MSSTDTKALWICHGFAIGLCVTRLILRKVHRHAFTAGDYWTVVALVCITLRATLNALILAGGTTTSDLPAIKAGLRPPGRLDPEVYDRVILNSKLNVVNRLTVNTLLWSLKMVVLDLCARLISKMPKEKLIKYTFWTVFGATYLAGQLAVLLECRPFHLYWQIFPDPGKCVNGNMWLITYEVGNLITDIMLLVFPFPVLFAAKVHWQKKAQLCSLFSIGIFLVAVSCVRIIQGVPHARSQLSRTVWGSVETLFASIVAQVPTLYTLLRNTTQSSSYQVPEDTYRLASTTNQTSRSKARRSGKGGDIELGDKAFDGNDDLYRARGYADRTLSPRPADTDGENESTKGILVTVDITQVEKSEARHRVTEVSSQHS